MMAEEEQERYVIEHEGEEHLFEELFRFTVEETETSYIVLVSVEDNESDEYEEGKVTEVLQAGYKLKDKVIRPTMVKVAK